jgi:acyl-CoA dehydrogenase
MLKRCSARLCATTGSGMCFDLSPTQRDIQEGARRFAQDVIKPRAAELDRTMAYPDEIFEQAWRLGFVNPHIPEAYGGVSASVLEECLIAEELSWGCTGVATALSLNAIAEAPLIRGGSEAQKKKYLGRMTEAPLKAAYCVTEPSAGSDVAGMKTTARREGDKWIINGSKMWITNGGVANWYFLLAKTEEGYTGFIIDADADGVRRGKKETMMGQRCSDTRAVHFENVVVGADAVLGRPGDGFKLAMATFDQSRPVVAINAVGLARRAMEEARDYANERTTMGKPIKEHQAVAFMIADMASGIEAGRLLAHRAAVEYDQGRRNTHVASMAKLFAADHCQRVCTDAVQVFGGNGFNTGYPVEKLYRDSKIFQIYEGTSQIQRIIISRHLFA